MTWGLRLLAAGWAVRRGARAAWRTLVRLVMLRPAPTAPRSWLDEPRGWRDDTPAGPGDWWTAHHAERDRLRGYSIPRRKWRA